MNTKNKIYITMLSLTILILIVINASTQMKLEKQIEFYQLLNTEIEKTMIPKDELIDYVTNISITVNEYLLHKNEISDSISNYQYPILIYGYPEKECGMCINKDLRQLYQFQETIGKEHICIISVFSENRNNTNRLKNELSSFNHKNISKMTNITHRYYGIINGNGTLEMIFLPKVDMLDLTNAYFDSIKYKFNLKDSIK